MAKTKKDHLYCLDTNESKNLMSIPKKYDRDIKWSKGNNANYISTDFTPYDSSDELNGTLAGVSVNIKHKKPMRIKSSSKTVITLFQLKNRVKLRAYQVEACDENNISSYDMNNAIYGCHEHVGKEVIKIKPLYKIEDIYSWFNLFCDKVNLEFKGKLMDIANEQ